VAALNASINPRDHRLNSRLAGFEAGAYSFEVAKKRKKKKKKKQNEYGV
jgi:hypothetical protein